MAPFFFTTDRYIKGLVHANYTSGAPVRGNLTLRATLKPMENRFMPGFGGIQPQQPQDRDRERERGGGYVGGLYRPQVVEKYFNFVS